MVSLKNIMHLTIPKINEIIRSQLNKKYMISDDQLEISFRNSPSVIKNTSTIKRILESENIPKQKINRIIKKMECFHVSPGTKASIRGLAFNQMVSKVLKETLKKMKRTDIIFQVEKKNANVSEIPDWTLIHTKKKKSIIGYNQLDLWHGGAQLNRASKYILDDRYHNKKRIKIVSIIARMPPSIKSNKNKIYSIFDVGFRKKRLFYLQSLIQYIKIWALR